jgi:site-specific DNA-methyltransferase (adenine-specific)
MNTLYYGDNLQILSESIPPGSVDLIYLDPPFNSKQDYNVYLAADAQTKAFEDTWQWTDETTAAMDGLVPRNRSLYNLLACLTETSGRNSLGAYLVMMAVRLTEMKRVLKDTGSIYLHCDPTASHYLKVVMDRIFGEDRFLNDIVWKRTSAHGGARKWGRIHDDILFYSRSPVFTWNKVFTEYDDEYVRKAFSRSDEGGRYRVENLTAGGIRRGDSGKPWRGIDPAAKGSHWNVARAFLNAPDMPVNTLEALDYLDSIGRIHWPKKGVMLGLKKYLHEMPGTAAQDIIADIPPLPKSAKERLGYPMQKPVALLKRIISVSSNHGDVVLDPFCGCGTAIEAAEDLDRSG